MSEGRAGGASRSRLGRRDLDRTVWGVRHTAGASAILIERCRMFAARMPADAFFSHSTAALLLGMPLPLREERASRLHIAMSAPRRAPHAHGIAGHRLRVGPADVTVRDNLRLTAPARTWRDLATVLSLIELVAAGDHLVHWRLPACSKADLGAALPPVGSRGGAVLRTAIALLDDRAESPRESAVRVILALGGLPRPRINHVVVEVEGGHGVRTDFAFPDLKFAIEYQGDYHRSRRQWRADMTRRTRLESVGWYILEINADDLDDPAELVARIRRILGRRR